MINTNQIIKKITNKTKNKIINKNINDYHLFNQKNLQLLGKIIYELQYKLLHYLIFFSIIFGICYYFSEDIYLFISKPVRKIFGNSIFIYTNLWEVFSSKISISSYTALFISMPFFLYQGFLFIKKGLYKNEQKLLHYMMILSTIMFIIGFLTMYYIILPNGLNFIRNIYQNYVTPQLKISEYVSSFLSLTFGFGLMFQFPIIIHLLLKFNIIDKKFLQNNRKIAILIIFIFAAIITPPDILSQIICAIILITFYELSILWACV